MNRDHMLGWPPALLVADDPPVKPRPVATYHRRRAPSPTPATSVPVIRTRLSQAEQNQRAVDDRHIMQSMTRVLAIEEHAALNKRLAGMPPPVNAALNERLADDWVYCKNSGDETIVHRIRGDVAEYARPAAPLWVKSPWPLANVRTFPVVPRPDWDPDLKPAPALEYPKYYRHKEREAHYRLDQDGDVYIGRRSGIWCPADWSPAELFVPQVAPITEDQLPAYLRPYEVPAPPKREYRVRRHDNIDGSFNLYRMHDGQLEYWHRHGRGWLRTAMCNWDKLIPATPEQLSTLPPEALK